MNPFNAQLEQYKLSILVISAYKECNSPSPFLFF